MTRPHTPAASHRVTEFEPERLTKAASPVGELAFALPAVQILLVEDDETVRRLLAPLLDQEGFRVTAVTTGQAALQSLTKTGADILLTDYRLPDIDGVAVLQRAREEMPNIVGIMMTGYGTIDLAIKAMRAGAFDILLKPFQPDDVLMAVKRVVEVHRLRRENGLLKQTVLKMAGVQPQAFRLRDMTQLGAPLHENTAGAGGGVGEYERGLAEGERRAHERSAGQQRQETVLAAVAKQLGEAISSWPRQTEEQVVSLALAIARKVVRQCADEKRDLVVMQAREAVSRVRDNREIHIRVHPRDLAVMEGVRDMLEGVCDGPVTFRIEVDPTIAPGGCVVETTTCLVDATLETQMARLAEGLKENMSDEAG
ncbi:MAG: response regulator [Nitrospiraceae bacterium]